MKASWIAVLSVLAVIPGFASDATAQPAQSAPEFKEVSISPLRARLRQTVAQLREAAARADKLKVLEAMADDFQKVGDDRSKPVAHRAQALGVESATRISLYILRHNETSAPDAGCSLARQRIRSDGTPPGAEELVPDTDLPGVARAALKLLDLVCSPH